MNDDIIRMAREAGFPVDEHGYNTKRIERFAALVAAHERERVMNEPLTNAMWDRFESEIRADEREACAKVCEELRSGYTTLQADIAATQCAAAIRARGEK